MTATRSDIVDLAPRIATVVILLLVASRWLKKARHKDTCAISREVHFRASDGTEAGAEEEWELADRDCDFESYCDSEQYLVPESQ